MKQIIRESIQLITAAHPLAFWVLILGLYAAIGLLSACGIITWFPEILHNPARATYIGEQLFQLATGTLCVSGVSSLLMDMIIQKDGLQ